MNGLGVSGSEVIIDGQNLRTTSFSARYGAKPVTVKNLTANTVTFEGRYAVLS